MKRFLLKTLNFWVTFILLFSTQALAEPKPFPEESLTYANPNFARTIPYNERIEMLKAIEKNNQSVVELFTLDDYGKSQGNRSLYVAKVGAGPIKVWVQAGVQGNESSTTEIVLKMLNTLGSDPSNEIQTILDHVTLYAIPIYNVDGYEMNGTNSIDMNEMGKVIKKNLDLNDSLKIPLNDQKDTFITDEFITYYKYWCAVKPDFALDIRYQNIKDRNDLNDSPTFSMGISLAPNGPILSSLEEGYFNDITRQIHGYVYHALKDSGYTHITRYQVNKHALDIYDNILSAMMLGVNHKNLNPDHYSCPAVFFETYGNTEKDSLIQPSNRDVIEQNALALKAFLYGIATGEVKDVDPQCWEEIPYPATKE